MRAMVKDLAELNGVLHSRSALDGKFQSLDRNQFLIYIDVYSCNAMKAF